MIRVDSILIENFRGIRKLSLNLAEKNFAICGPNGTGKSGVVDALEFALTGNITRLIGQGTSGISVRSHAPHVDTRSDPAKAKVTLKATIPALKKKVVIERFVSNPSAPLIQPNEPDVLAIMAELGKHPEFALSRREIIKYVITPPGERSKEVQALLRLDRVERVRQSLQTIANSYKASVKRLTNERAEAQGNLTRSLGIAQLTKNDLLEAVNERRTILGLEALSDIDKNTSLKSGLRTPSNNSSSQLKIRKKEALGTIERFEKLISTPDVEDIVKIRKSAVANLLTLIESPALLRSMRREIFLKKGLELIEEEVCPLCDDEWDSTALRQHLEKKLREATRAGEIKDALNRAISTLANVLRDLVALMRVIQGYGNQVNPIIDARSLGDCAKALEMKANEMLELADLSKIFDGLQNGWRELPIPVNETLQQLKKAVDTLPDPSRQDEATDFLVVCNERLDIYRSARNELEAATKDSELATRVFDTYNDVSNMVLTQIYRDVEQDFTRYYRYINREDEDTFEGRLTPSLGKLGFEVDFYGRGFFPPGAYHSEGHQDGMGLCLYLALMKRTLGGNFTFAVLDDVLMSVDTGHRREVCGLLKSEFPNTQFILTTHDQIWLQHMKSEQIITNRSSVHFRKWTVDDGPVVWDDKEVWKNIDCDLDEDNTPQAAGTLRRFLEYVAAYLSDKLRARIEFHGDAQYDLGELLPGVINTWNDLLAKAQEASQSWGKADDVLALTKRQKEFKGCVERSQVNQWAINKSIHYNEWTNLKKKDFVPVAEAFKSLLDCFRCPDCGAYFYVTPPKGSREGIRCDCGAGFNLKKKTKNKAAEGNGNHVRTSAAAQALPFTQ